MKNKNIWIYFDKKDVIIKGLVEQLPFIERLKILINPKVTLVLKDAKTKIKGKQ